MGKMEQEANSLIVLAAAWVWAYPSSRLWIITMQSHYTYDRTETFSVSHPQQANSRCQDGALTVNGKGRPEDAGFFL